MYEYLDRRYALALYEVAEKKGKVDEYLGDLREICELIESNKDFFEVIKHPQIGTKQKKKTFINVLQGIEKTTVPLEENEYNSLVEKLEKKYNKEVILKKEIDPEILGGIYVRIGNDVIDGTVKTRLDDLEKLMLATE